jgi:hypothetical protein
MKPYLTAEQVFQLNEKHGLFHYGEAQSDVSKAFAQDAIEMHERMRAAAPDLLAALKACYDLIAEECADGEYTLQAEQARAAIDKATGSAS